MKNTENQAIALIKNEDFVRWVKHPTAALDHYWSQWAQAQSGREKQVALARQVILSAQYAHAPKMPATDYHRVMEHIVNHSHSRALRPRQRFLRSWKYTGIAASLLLAMTLGIWQYLAHQSAQTLPTKTITKTTLRGQKLMVRLPDGSKAMLNAESKLTYTLPFEGNRTVALVGEAFFEVVKNPESPFVVQAGGITTKVLGTSFNVRAYPEEQARAISVVTGKVTVADAHGNKALLNPKARGVFDLAKKQLLIEPFSPKHDIGWKDGRIDFDNTPLPDALARLDRWYGVDFVVQDSTLLTGGYTGTYQNASLERVMDGISLASGFNYTIQDKTVTIIKKVP